MEILELFEKLSNDLDKQLIQPRIILDQASVLDESTRKTAAYQDPTYIPFYFYLNKHIQPKNLLEIGFRLGFMSRAFLHQNDSVDNFLTFQKEEKEFYSSRLGLSNIKSIYKKKFDFYYGQLEDEAFTQKLNESKWDIVFMNEEFNYDQYRNYLDIIYPHLNTGGLLIMDYVISNKASKESFNDFAKISNRKPFILKTRYGTGIIQK